MFQVRDEVLKLLRYSLIDRDKAYSSVYSQEQWEEILEELRCQACLDIVYHAICKVQNKPLDVTEYCKNVVIEKMITWMKQAEEQKLILDLLSENNIKAVVLKGHAVGCYYPEPDKRSSGDIDIIVEKEKYDLAHKILIENGYNYNAGSKVDYHREYSKNDVEFEIHHTLSRISNRKKGNYVRKLIADGIENLEYVNVNRYKVPVFPMLQNGIVLIMHIQQHMPLGLGFKQIVDWMMFANSCLDDTGWKKIEAEFDKCGLSKPAKIVTRTCQLYLGLREDDITWCKDVSDNECKELINYIFIKGQFGRKEKQTEKGIYALTRDKDISTGFKRLQNHGEKNWDASKKYVILKPFAWLYTVWTYLVFLFTRKKPIQALHRDISISHQRKKLLKKMNIYE